MSPVEEEPGMVKSASMSLDRRYLASLVKGLRRSLSRRKKKNSRTVQLKSPLSKKDLLQKTSPLSTKEKKPASKNQEKDLREAVCDDGGDDDGFEEPQITPSEAFPSPLAPLDSGFETLILPELSATRVSILRPLTTNGSVTADAIDLCLDSYRPSITSAEGDGSPENNTNSPEHFFQREHEKIKKTKTSSSESLSAASSSSSSSSKKGGAGANKNKIKKTKRNDDLLVF